MSCIITGAGSGIGRAAAVEISRRGYFSDLILIGRRAAALEETRALLAPGCAADAVPFDLNRLDDIPALIDDINRRHGGIDCLLNVAGHADPQPLVTTSTGSLVTTYTTNVFAPVTLIRECVKYMRGRPEPAKIINVASTAAVTDRPGWLAYASSKASLVSISRILSEELAEYGIKVYCVSPGRCATALRKILAPAEDPDTIMQPFQVGNVLADLASPTEQCLDGQNIIVRKRQ